MRCKLVKRLVSLSVLITLLLTSTVGVAKAEEGVTSSEVNFGTVYPLTGVLSPGASSYYKGIKTYFRYVNANGGIYGRKINLLENDSQGIVSRTITASNALLQNGNTFAFLASAPSCSTHIAFLQSTRLADRGIPDVLSDCNFSLGEGDGESRADLFSGSTFSKLNYDSEYLIINHYLQSNLADKRIALIYQDDDLGNAAEKIFKSEKIICRKSFVAGTESIFTPICNSSTSALQNDDVVIFIGSAVGLMRVISSYSSQNLNLKYFTNFDAYNPKLFSAYGGSKITSLAEIYSITSNYLISDLKNEAVATFLSIAQENSQSSEINQQFLNGMNSGYLVANVIGAVGSELTRTRFQQALLLFGNQFDALGLSDRSTSINSKLTPTGGVVVKHLGNLDQYVSDLLVVSTGQVSRNSKKSISINSKALPISKQLLVPSLQTPAPTPEVSSSPKPVVTPIQTPQVNPVSPSAEAEEIELEGEEEEPFGKILVKKDKTKYAISIESNLADELLQVRATKKSQKSIIFKVTTNGDGNAKFTTRRVLSGYQLALLFDGKILSSVKAG